MVIPETSDRPLRGVAMDETERDEFLREPGIGVLSLASEDVAYGFPISFGWDGEHLYFILLQFGEGSEKLDYAATTERATFRRTTSRANTTGAASSRAAPSRKSWLTTLTTSPR